MGTPTPKQFMVLMGKPILQRSIEIFNRLSSIDEIVVVVPADQIRRAERLIKRAHLHKVSHVVVGGAERQDSVRHGLSAFDREPEIVLVHDAVRPLVTRDEVLRVIKQARRCGAAILAVPVKDTIKVGESGFSTRTLDREKLWAVQTPQGFRYEILVRAHRAAQRSAFLGTDEASLVERLRVPVAIVSGSYRNIKITTKEDFTIAQAFLTSSGGTLASR
jgi:2-C-methyl-D-erythritol 4-phosphate cytidylyltransferase